MGADDLIDLVPDNSHVAAIDAVQGRASRAMLLIIQERLQEKFKPAVRILRNPRPIDMKYVFKYL